MADDHSDIPPLEDMTDVLKQANAIREQLDKGNEGKGVKAQKSKAKVNKKHPTPHAIPTTECQDKLSPSQENRDETKIGKDSNESHVVADNPHLPCLPKNETTGLFGGMKKGFLFGSSPKPSPKVLSSTTGSRNIETIKKPSKEIPATKEKSVEKAKSDDIPYISPKGTVESGLSFNEVQQAMSEAKGLMENQDWVTDDLLNKVEKNDYLIKRFSDPKFMTALQEFQTNPEAAMMKYKGNTEVEKFLTEFTGLLGDHFTHIGESKEKETKTPMSHQSTSSSKVNAPKVNQAKPTPKIMEITDDDTPTSTTKISNVSGNLTSMTQSSSSPLEKLSNVNRQEAVRGQISEIKTHSTDNKADIEEVKNSSDKEVQEMLTDPKVMETLMDPQIMNLIQTLKDDPAKGQRIVDEADSDLKKKVHFLVSKGLLQFQR